MKLGFLVAALALLVAQAGAVSVNRTKTSLAQTKDDSGYPLTLESDKAWKVFEVFNTTDETQVTDEDNVAPTSGILNRVCVESAEESGGNFAYVLVWDSAASTGGVAVSGRRLLPPVHRVSDQLYCTAEVNALFTLGLRIDQSGQPGATYVYWRPLGGKR